MTSFSLDDYLGKADMRILFSKILYLKLVKPTRTWNQLFKSPVLWGWGHIHCLDGLWALWPAGRYPRSLWEVGPVNGTPCVGPVHPQGPGVGSCTSFWHVMKTQILFFRYASALPPLPNLFCFLAPLLPPINTSESASSASQKSLRSSKIPAVIPPTLLCGKRPLLAPLQAPPFPGPLPSPAKHSVQIFSLQALGVSLAPLCFFLSLFKHRPLFSLAFCGSSQALSVTPALSSVETGFHSRSMQSMTHRPGGAAWPPTVPAIQ